MSKYAIDNHLPKVGEIILQSGMTLRVSAEDGTSEGPCDIVFGKLYIYPESPTSTLVELGEDVEILSEQRNIDELERRKSAVVQSQLDWRDRRSIDPSNESW